MVTIDGIPYLTVAEVCALLSVKPATVYAYVSRGVLHSYKQGIRRQRLYRQDEVEALLTVQAGGSLAAPEMDPAPEDTLLRLPRAEGWIGEL
jgi:excisionase family DNA binding protein